MNKINLIIAYAASITCFLTGITQWNRSPLLAWMVLCATCPWFITAKYFKEKL